LNLGCPQWTVFVGHFGLYLLGHEDWELVLSIVQAGGQAVSIPIIFCKIRLLDTLEETMELVVQLRDAGASLIAIHAHYHASFQWKWPGARNGPALLDQEMEI
jgi:tRNA-dihydrouridine synthase